MPDKTNKKQLEQPPDLGGIFARIGKKEEESPSPPPKPAKAEEPPDRKSLKSLRENLLAYGWARENVYSISAKFFGKRTAAELDEQYRKLLNSLNYLESAEENADLALKLLLDEMTSAEAVKKSLSRKAGAELKHALAGTGWPAEKIEKIAAKYAGDKTAADIETRYRMILSELPHRRTPEENSDLALDVLEDKGAYPQARILAERRKYAAEIAELLGPLPEGCASRLAEKFSGAAAPAELLEKCRAVSEEIRAGAYPGDFLPALRVLLGEIEKADAAREMRALKNQDDIARMTEELGTTQRQTAKLVANCAQSKSAHWFDEEFLRLFNALAQYPDSDRKNALISLRVLAGEIAEEQALDEARRAKNRADIAALAADLRLDQECADKLLERYDIAGAPAFAGAEYARLLSAIPCPQESHKSAGRLAVKVLLGEITEEAAVNMAELAGAFGKFALPESDLSAIADKYLGKKTAGELLLSFEFILDKLPFVQSFEENYGLALDVLINGGAQSLDAAVSRAALKRDLMEYRKALNSYGWFSGYASDLCEKYFGKKDAQALIADFEALLEALPHEAKPTENYDLGMRVLLEKISSAEAQREAELRKLLRAEPWGRDYAAEMAAAYLGDLLPEELAGFLKERFERSDFWKREQPLHRYIAARTIEELSGKSETRQTEMLFELLALGVPLEAVKDIEQSVPRLAGRHFDPKDIAKRYAAVAAQSGAHSGAGGVFLELVLNPV